MRNEVMEFFGRTVVPDEFHGKRILEVGSENVNGSIRPLIENLQPSEFIGIDLHLGIGVDLVLAAEKIVQYFGSESFDVIVSTDTLEHVVDWRAVIRNMKEALRPKGYLYLTAAPMGFQYHPYPYDLWRFTLSDMQKIFADFEVIKLEEGVLLKARKPENYVPINLSEIPLYSMMLKTTTKEIPASLIV